MAQHDYNIANQGFPAFRADLNNVLNAIVSNNSGATTPSTTYAYQFWYDTNANIWKMRNADNDAWISLASFDQTNDTVNFLDSTVSIVGLSTSATGTVLTLTDTSLNSTVDIQLPDTKAIEDDSGNEYIKFSKTTSAVNELTVTNQATGNDPSLSATGDDSNISIAIKPKGTGETVIGTGSASATLTTSGAHDLILDTNKGTNSGNITITDGANGNIDVTTNGTGYIKFNDLAYIPQQALTSTSNAVAWDVQAKPNAYHLTTENTTFSAPTNSVEGSFICLEINYNGAHTIAFNTVFEFAASTAPTFTSTDGKTDILVFRYNGAVWQEVGRTLNLSES